MGQSRVASVRAVCKADDDFCRLGWGDIFGKMYIDHLTANAISK
jgi:hypothetical protein